MNKLVGNFVKNRLRVRGVLKSGSITEKTAKRYGFVWEELYGWKDNVKGSQDHIQGMETVLNLIDACTKEEFYNQILLPAIEAENLKIKALRSERDAILRECAYEDWASKIIDEEESDAKFDEKEVRKFLDMMKSKRKKIDLKKIKSFKF